MASWMNKDADQQAPEFATVSTKSTLALDQAAREAEESKISVTELSANTGAKKKKAGRNRAKAQPSIEAGDYVDASDDEALQQAMKLALAAEEGEESGKPVVEESEAYVADQDMAAALDDSDIEESKVEAPESKEAKQSQVPDSKEAKQSQKVASQKAAKKKAPAKKDPAEKKEKAAAPAKAAKDDKAGNKHAKQQPTKVMMNEKEAHAAVSEYMQSQNRPYSLQNVMDNLHGRIPRKICEKVLDDLTKESHLVCKEFGKAKIYMPN